MEGIGSQMNQNSLVQFEPFDLNNQNQTLDGYNLLSTMQGTPVNDLHTSTWVENPNSFSGAPQNVPNFTVSEPSPYPLAALSSYLSNQFTNGLSSSFTSSVSYAPVVAGFQPCVTIANPFGSSSLSNELSLSLATSQPSAVNVTNVSDQCSEISSGSRELSLSCGSYHNGRVSSVLTGSRYLQVVQEILTEIASYSLEVLEEMSSSNGGIKMGGNMPLSSIFICPNEDNVFKVDGDPALQKRALQAKKAQLLTLLQLVDDRYGQCLDEIHTVISAFHAATELDPQLHTCFALQTLSFLYKSFRERISNQILALTDHGERGLEKESDHFQKQWTLQQLKKKDHPMWKPQRGLPERSVSVLRAWMFQNFLHPYPKDAEKHLLAVKSGLTRSQVSNWFINARVRLWKPMIEEMYAEMNKRKGEGSSSNHRNEFSFGNLRFNIGGM